MIFVNQTLSDTVARFNKCNVKRLVIADPRLGATSIVGRYPICAPELFARDIGEFLGVPIEVDGDCILIGRRPH